MIVAAFHPAEFAPPGGVARKMSEEKSAELFRAIVAASTITSIGGGFIGLEVSRPKPDGPMLYQWHFTDGDAETAQAHIQIMLDKTARPVLEGARWRPGWL